MLYYLPQMLDAASVTITVKGKAARIASFLPTRGWTLHSKGYLIWTSRGTRLRRGTRAHRAAIERLMGEPLSPDVHVHHQDFDKLNCCPCNLIVMPAAFNPSCALRDPYTGEFLSRVQWERRYA